MKKILQKKKIVKWLFGLAFLLLLPLLIVKCVIYFSSPKDIETIQNADAVIVFGTLVRDGQVSALMKQRLETARAIYTKKKAKTIVVSNTESASLVMRDYLIEKGVPQADIELDIGAVRTVDSCIREMKTHGRQRQLIFVSQDYHLPRIAFQCWRKDLRGQVFAAEYFNLEPTPISFLKIVFIRTQRHVREAALLWFSIFRN